MAKREIRPIRVEGQVAYVPLTKGYTAIIDAEDVPLVADYNWFAQVERRADGNIARVYAVRHAMRRAVLLHRFLAQTPDGLETDHIDGNGLNNRRSNLRQATQAQNRQNARTRVDNAAGIKGVCWHGHSRKWLAQIRVDGKQRHLGIFKCRTAAAFAYAKASRKLHGEFGRVA